MLALISKILNNGVSNCIQSTAGAMKLHVSSLQRGPWPRASSVFISSSMTWLCNYNIRRNSFDYSFLKFYLCGDYIMCYRNRAIRNLHKGSSGTCRFSKRRGHNILKFSDQSLYLTRIFFITKWHPRSVQRSK